MKARALTSWTLVGFSLASLMINAIVFAAVRPVFDETL